MAAIQDTAGIFTGAILDAFNEMEAVVAVGGDAAGAGDRLLPVMQQIIIDKQATDNSGGDLEGSPR